MQLKKIQLLFVAVASLIFFPGQASGLEMETRYATVIYDTVETLRKFDNNLYMGNLKYLLQGKKSETIQDEVCNKIDLIIEKVETILDMYPAKIKVIIVVYSSTEGVQKDFQRIYNKKTDYIAFYSPIENTVFYSAKHASLRVVSHEIAHMVVENYFAVSPPPKIHEVLAQYAEMHITD
ncbi:MAG: hypothetical protein RBT11_08365 [Desulfobacterales bacterium]|jgi:hypothetical protein|nr:hypothetical protein [Desulfobacterales bacterium]